MSSEPGSLYRLHPESTKSIAYSPSPRQSYQNDGSLPSKRILFILALVALVFDFRHTPFVLRTREVTDKRTAVQIARYALRSRYGGKTRQYEPYAAVLLDSVWVVKGAQRPGREPL